jgi:GNAT superfamily N-acetyltransferase
MADADPVLRTELRPGDVGRIVEAHGRIYAAEQGWDVTFEAYVAGPLAEFVKARPERGRIWIAERGGRFAGCVAIVPAGERAAQLRWFLVDPAERGRGLGTRLLADAVAFARDEGFGEAFLWTERSLAAAARLYARAGFVLAESVPGRAWGSDVVEERHVLDLRRA